jgi:SAM-dependent methyltransferase
MNLGSADQGGAASPPAPKQLPGDGPEVHPDAGEATAPCPICADPSAPERYQLREMLFGTRETFDYLRCPTCGALRIEEPPADLARHYPAAFFRFDSPTTAAAGTQPKPSVLAAIAGSARDRSALLGRGRRVARMLERWAPREPDEVRRWSPLTRRAGIRSYDDPILDIGCGRYATNLASLRAVGFRNLLGIDPFLEGDGEFEGIPLRKQFISEATGSYQAITFHHSFEHVPDPGPTLAAAARLLRPGGAVLVRTPVMGTWFWETYGTRWWELDPPRHLFVHTPDSLERLGRQAGLALVDTVWESSFVEVIASEQITRDIAWREPASWNMNPPAGIDKETIAGFRTLVTDLNNTARAGRAAFYFRLDPAAHA